MNHASQGGGKGVEQQAAEFAQDTLLPWTARLEEADSQLLPRGQFLKYNIDASIRPDIATQYEVYNAGRLGGYLCADDVREKIDMAPLPDGQGQVFLMPANTVSVEQALNPPPPPEPAPVPDALVPPGDPGGDT